MVEAERRAFADRAEFMGDPDFIEDKTQMLISEEYLKNRWKNFSFEKATPSCRSWENYCSTSKNLPKLRIFLLLINLEMQLL